VLRHRGFTLVEILLELLIIAIMASAVGLAARPTDARELAIAAQQWRKALQGLSAESVAQGEVLALSLRNDEASIRSWRRERWEDYPLLSELPTTPDHAQLSLRQIEDGARVLLFPSGEISPFELELRSTAVDARYLLRSDGLQVSVEEVQ
jgi:type II secretion system protein H